MDDLRAAITKRMQRPAPTPFAIDPDKERRAGALEQLQRTDPRTAASEHLETERNLIANYLHRKALAAGATEGNDAA